MSSPFKLLLSSLNYSEKVLNSRPRRTDKEASEPGFSGSGGSVRNLAKRFRSPRLPSHRQYEALRTFYLDRIPAQEVARRFGYTLSAFYSLTRDFARDARMERFFTQRQPRPWSRTPGKMARLRERIIGLRKRYWSIYDIENQLRREGTALDATAIWRLLRQAGFTKLPRRLEEERRQSGPVPKKGG